MFAEEVLHVPLFGNDANLCLLVARPQFHTAPIFLRCSSTRAASVATSSVSLRQRRGVAFGQLADAAGEGLRDAIQLALHGGGEARQPLVVHHQRLDLVLGELGVLVVGQLVECGLWLP